VGLFVFGFIFLLFLALPVLAGELTTFIQSFPRYVTQIQSLAVETA
jgi:hypothetical protein